MTGWWNLPIALVAFALLLLAVRRLLGCHGEVILNGDMRRFRLIARKRANWEMCAIVSLSVFAVSFVFFLKDVAL